MPKAHRLLLAGMVAALFGQPVGAEDLLQVYRQSMESDPALKVAAASQQASQEAKPRRRQPASLPGSQTAGPSPVVAERGCYGLAWQYLWGGGRVDRQ